MCSYFYNIEYFESETMFLFEQTAEWIRTILELFFYTKRAGVLTVRRDLKSTREIFKLFFWFSLKYLLEIYHNKFDV